jgi:adenylate kinase
MFNLIVFGPPGSGKGTQSVMIAEKYNLVHLSTGDVLRREIREKSPLGLKVQGVMEKGELVSDDLLLEILRSAFRQAGNPKGFVLDGYPRTVRQARDLDELLAEKGENVTLALALEVNEEEVVARLLKRAQLEGRKDDTEDVIRNRMKVYHEQTHPLMEYYNKQQKLKSLAGGGSIEDIFNDICKVIDLT